MSNLTNSPLTARQAQVLYQIATGKNIDQAAQALHMSPHTCRQHLECIFKALRVHKMTHAVIAFYYNIYPPYSVEIVNSNETI